ncbi:methyltransferase domain-containing protein [Halobaculum roseum]|uniref:Methyltransferase domain-containing protein n=1 Tax=Halobaculum roseum TaxID=2175149 RepID=A0ABD5MHE5_9EURY|nr:methyltransferase domain-containing protein [Halobaculum roseum]QZY02918.1 methyltransferase domain-containing protein [Halobaculum roseum]
MTRDAGTFEYDAEEARAEEDAYRTAGAAERRRFVRESLDPTDGETVVSVGCGPGFEPLELADAVGEDGEVVGVDRSSPMCALARDRLASSPNARVARGDATDLPIARDAADAATVVQVLQYVEDPSTALAELRRVLRTGGRAAVFLADWDTFVVRGGDPDRTETVLASWRDHCAHPTLGSRLRGPAESAGFSVRSIDPYTVADADPTPDSFAGTLIEFVTEFAADHDAVTRTVADAWRAEIRDAISGGTGFVGLTGYCYLLETTTGR